MVDGRECRVPFRLFGLLALTFVRLLAYQVAILTPWLLIAILVIGVGLGVGIGGMQWWWVGIPAALFGASLAPAWADSLHRSGWVR